MNRYKRNKVAERMLISNVVGSHKNDDKDSEDDTSRKKKPQPEARVHRNLHQTEPIKPKPTHKNLKNGVTTAAETAAGKRSGKKKKCPGH